MLVFLFLVLGVSCILPVCSGLPFKLPFSNISLCFCLSKKKIICVYPPPIYTLTHTEIVKE